MSLAILCPGQGGQHAAMFDLVGANAAACAVLGETNSAASIDVVAAARTGADIFRNAVAQPLICAYQVAAWAALAPLLPAPALIAGYSVGELASYGCASALSPGELVRLARRRAALMDGASKEPAGLVALRGISLSRVEALCAQHGAEIAIVNGDDHFICGGADSALAGTAAAAEALGATAQRLNVSVAAHTSLLSGAIPAFRESLENSPLADPRIPVLAGISGATVNDRQSAIDALSRQIGQTVRWADCLDAAYERGCRVFLELGPGNALARMTMERFSDAAARSVSEFRSLAAVARWTGRALI